MKVLIAVAVLPAQHYSPQHVSKLLACPTKVELFSVPVRDSAVRGRHVSVCSGRADKPRAGLSPGMRAAGMGSKRLWPAEHHGAAQPGLLGAAPAPEWGQADG